MILKILIILSILCSPVYATTYYIAAFGLDTNDGLSKIAPWKNAPGMPEFSGTYTHAPGDMFVLRGGDTWVFTNSNWIISNSGERGNPDIYTSDKTWYSGSFWTYPVLDGDHSTPLGKGLITIDTREHDITINGLKLINAGTAGTLYGAMAIYATYNLGGITVSNCRIQTYSQHGLTLRPDWDNLTETLDPGVEVFGNDLSDCTNFLEMGGTQGPPYDYKFGVYIHDNVFHDPHSVLLDGDHGDSIHLWNAYRGTGEWVLYYTGAIYNNHWYGDFSPSDEITGNTAQIYLECSTDGMDIYNNVLSFDNTDSIREEYLFSPGMFTEYSCKNLNIWNNTFTSNKMYAANRGGKTAVRIDNKYDTDDIVHPSDNIKVQGNIFDHITKTVVSIATDSQNIYLDYNIYADPLEQYGGLGSVFNSSMADWQTALQNAPYVTGNEEHSIDAPVNFNDITRVPMDLTLADNSPAIDALPTSIAPTATFTTDILGVSRPQGSAWDMGAYEYNGQAPPVVSKQLYTYGGNLATYNGMLIGE